jgi:hypothetical protein
VSAQTEPEISKEDVSVHEVKRGNMPLLFEFDGEVVALIPPQGLFTVPEATEPKPKVGEKAVTQFKPPDIQTGKIVGLDRVGSNGITELRVEFSRAFPPETVVGTKLKTMIEVGELSNVLFFARPATAQANSTMALFVIEPKGQFAERTTVHFGRLSGPWIEILSGLVPGDRVIVTDTSKWTSNERLRLK